jgi:quinol monooxygenase YgiN
MFIVDACITIRPDQRSGFLALMDRVVSLTRQESDNLGFRLTADLVDPGTFFLFEHWKSEDALREHLRQPYLVELGAAAPGFGFAISGTVHHTDHSETAEELLRRVR